MSIPSGTVWEVRSATGSDNNGGGFVAGGSGTDYSQQNSPQLSVADVVTNGTTTVTSATGGFTTQMVDNLINIVGDGIYRITVRTDTNTITVDRATGTGTGQTGNVGGALATFTKLASVMVGSNKAYVKGTGFTSTATLTFAQTVTPVDNVPHSTIIGYQTTRGDGGLATLTLQTNTGLTGLNFTGDGWRVESMEVDCATLGTSTGIRLGGSYSYARRCRAKNFTTLGIVMSGSSDTICECEVTGGTSAATAAIFAELGAAARVHYNYVHDNACLGINLTLEHGVVERNLVVNNTGATSDGIQTYWGPHILHNTCHGNGRHGIAQYSSNYRLQLEVRGNLCTSNGGYGIALALTGGLPPSPLYDGNAFYNNTSGERGGMSTNTGADQVNAYTNVYDVTLTGLPYANAAGGNFALDNTAGQGAACRGVAVPNTWLGASTTGYLDMGAVQHQDSGGGGSGGISRSRAIGGV